MKQFISPTGFDYTEYIETEENLKDFEKICELEESVRNVPFKECTHRVAEAINLDRKLRSRGVPYAKVLVQGNPNLN